MSEKPGEREPASSPQNDRSEMTDPPAAAGTQHHTLLARLKKAEELGAALVKRLEELSLTEEIGATESREILDMLLQLRKVISLESRGTQPSLDEAAKQKRQEPAETDYPLNRDSTDGPVAHNRWLARKIDSWEGDLAFFRSEIEELKNKVKSVEEESCEVQRLKERLTHVKAERDRLRRQLDIANDSCTRRENNPHCLPRHRACR